LASKRVIARNVLFSWGGSAAEALVGFCVAPFLVHRLGDTSYGLWIVIAALTGYFGVLDLGIRPSVGRYLAFYRARHDTEGLNVTLSTAAVLLCGVGAVAMLGMLLAQLFFVGLFEVPPEAAGAARLALLLVSVNLALSFPLCLFEATLYAYQRFDLLGTVDTGATILRGGLTFYFIGSGYGIVALAVITLATSLGAGLVKGILSFREAPSIRFRWQYVRKSGVSILYGYGIWRVLIALAKLGMTRLNPLIIGAWLGMALVTPYALAARLISYVAEILQSVQAVLVPVATTLDAQDDHPAQQRLFIKGTQYSAIVAVYFLTGFLVLGRTFFGLWVGSRLADAAILLAILISGQFLPLSLAATNSILLGMARHRILAWLGLLEIVCVLVLAILVVNPFGLVGVCVVQALASTVCRGIVPLVYACRLLQLPIVKFIIRAYSPALGSAIAPAVALAALVAWHVPGRWDEFLIYGLSYSVCFAISSVIFLGLVRPVRTRHFQAYADSDKRFKTADSSAAS
jgi:O-antigen/teichoic acid export membrane protein